MESTSTTPDLPVTQPTGSGALAYPQGLPVGMSALDEMDGSGGFNPLGLIHSLRRQLLPAIGIGIVVSIMLGAVLWFLIPVKYTADAG